jgi:hypothetical protein
MIGLAQLTSVAKVMGTEFNVLPDPFDATFIQVSRLMRPLYMVGNKDDQKIKLLIGFIAKAILCHRKKKKEKIHSAIFLFIFI